MTLKKVFATLMASMEMGIMAIKAQPGWIIISRLHLTREKIKKGALCVPKPHMRW